MTVYVIAIVPPPHKPLPFIVSVSVVVKESPSKGEKLTFEEQEQPAILHTVLWAAAVF